MATTQSTEDSSNSNENEVPETEWSAIDYEDTNKKAYDSQQDVADAWAEGKFPTHNMNRDGEAVLYSGTPGNRRTTRRGVFGSSSSNNSDTPWSTSGARGTECNFYGVQRPDGTGTLWHYSTREAIRTKENVVISNQQCWSSGFAHCSKPDYDYSVPFDAVSNHFDSGDTVFDICGVLGQPETTASYSNHSESFRVSTSKNARNSVVLVDGSDNSYGIYIGRDGSIINGESHFSFRLSIEEVQELESPSDALDMLTPSEVSESSLDVVGSHIFAKTYLDESELEAHKEAGGNVRKSDSYYRDRMLNRQHFRADLQGNVIVRHGEFFFIPMPDADPEEVGTSYAANKMGSHRAMRHHGARSELPESCECGGKFHVENDGDTYCHDCGNDIKRPIYVRGQIVHSSNDHNAINLGETWHLAVKHDVDVRTYDDNPGSGSGGGGGWD